MLARNVKVEDDPDGSGEMLGLPCGDLSKPGDVILWCANQRRSSTASGMSREREIGSGTSCPVAKLQKPP